MVKYQKQQKKQNEHYNRKTDNHIHYQSFLSGKREIEEIIPGIPIIRSNTPRPYSFDMFVSGSDLLQDHDQNQRSQLRDTPHLFPAKAPLAPPLPEELEDDTMVKAEQEVQVNDQVGRGEFSEHGIIFAERSLTEEEIDTVWLFEYGLEMDVAVLNSRERLAGHAYLHGPAILKGYTLMLGAQRIHNHNGSTIITLVPESDAEVWGILYRVPRSFLDIIGLEPSLLDTIHAAIFPQKLFEGIEVVVLDQYQHREVSCITYIMMDLARQQVQLVPPDQWNGDIQFMQRLAEIARGHRLPEEYIRCYLFPAAMTNGRIPRVPPREQLRDIVQPKASLPSINVTSVPPSSLPSTNPALDAPVSQSKGQNTDAAMLALRKDLVSAIGMPQLVSEPRPRHRWLMLFSLYLVGLLVLLLVLALVHGMGLAHSELPNGFTPLGVPWQVLTYGLLGGCVSCIVSLSNMRAYDPPLFVMIAWFTRPFIGLLLAVFSYVLLTSGLFMFGGTFDRYPAFFWLIGVFAGLCEWCLFCRRR